MCNDVTSLSVQVTVVELNWRIGKEDVEFLQDVGAMEMGLVAQKWAEKKEWEAGKAERNCRAWLDRIRKRIIRYQGYLNKIRTLQRTNPRIRKLTTSGSLPEKDETEEEEWLS